VKTRKLVLLMRVIVPPINCTQSLYYAATPMCVLVLCPCSNTYTTPPQFCASLYHVPPFLCRLGVVVDYNKVNAGELYGSLDPGGGSGGCGDLENGAPVRNPGSESRNILMNLVTQCSWCEQIAQWHRSQPRSVTIAVPYTPPCHAKDANLRKAVSKSRLQHNGVK